MSHTDPKLVAEIDAIEDELIDAATDTGAELGSGGGEPTGGPYKPVDDPLKPTGGPYKPVSDPVEANVDEPVTAKTN